jgi:peptide/nickel transport system ATP-binding protein
MSSQPPKGKPLLQVEHLGVTFFTPRGTVRAVRDASLQVHRGEVMGVVGESGCGKSTTAFAVMGYLPGITQVDGQILFDGQDIAQMSAAELRHLRGNRIAMVYQDPATALNPTMKVGSQLEEVLREHMHMDSRQARRRTVELFESVRLSDPESVGRRYCHELSGGMQQRVVIAMALACEPDLLIMDEPTTGLDVTTEATILELVVDLKQRINAGILYVTHNLGVIAAVADRVVVMYAGETVEDAPVRELFKASKHPYTTGLLNCVPTPPGETGEVVQLSRIPGTVYSANDPAPGACLFVSRCPIAQESCRSQAPPILDTGAGHLSRCLYYENVTPAVWGELKPSVEEERAQSEPVLTARNMRRFYGSWGRKYLFFGPRVRPPIRAVTDVDFKVGLGRTLGIVGESGSGKTTVARAIVGLVPRDRGGLQLRDQELAPAVEGRTRAQQAAMRMVFQNPTASLNPKLPIRHAIVRALRKFSGLSKRESEQRAGELLRAVGLDPGFLNRHPGELSGGEQQRVAIAGAFAATPDIVIADEAVSALDVSVQAQVLNLLRTHQQETNTSYVFITHNLGVVRYLSDDILVLYAGHVAESGPAKKVLSAPSHPYTEALMSAAPIPDPDAKPTIIRLPGAVPTMRAQFQGCFFADRCPRKIGPVCDETPPPALMTPGGDHVIYCHIPLDELARPQVDGHDR